MAGQALDTAQHFLRRFCDPVTWNECEDLAQTAALQAWRYSTCVRDTARFPAMVRTISRRLRGKAVLVERAKAQRSVSLDERLVARLPTTASVRRDLLVCGVAVSIDWLLEQLDDLLTKFRPADVAMLRGFYGGLSCGHLAEEHGMAVAAVKWRLCRGRRRLRFELEERAREAGLLG